MSGRVSRMIMLMLGGVVLLVLAVLSLVPAAVPSDPTEGGQTALNQIRLASLALSTLFGSVSNLLFIRAILLVTGRRVGSRGTLAMCGALLMGFALLLVFGRIAFSSAGPVVAVLAWYFGGGLLLMASFPTKQDGREAAEAAR